MNKNVHDNMKKMTNNPNKKGENSEKCLFF